MICHLQILQYFCLLLGFVLFLFVTFIIIIILFKSLRQISFGLGEGFKTYATDLHYLS